MRRDNDRNSNFVEEPDEVYIPMATETKLKPVKPIKVGVHVIYDNEEYVVLSLKENDEIFICMGDKEHTVKKSDVKVI